MMYRIRLWAAAMVAHTNITISIDCIGGGDMPPGVEVENNNDDDDIGMLAKWRISLLQQAHQPNITVNLARLHDIIPRPPLHAIETNNPLPLPARLPLRDFCTKYNLSDEIFSKLDAVKITGPHTLHFYKEADLMDTVMLTLGELGSVLDAAEQWTWGLD
ncbi:hypothetical protein BT96DRAFT_993839 [Gymnopus androsaceus JB14]|uniref:Uncharacterized protein n=1 Tax=Gymnopus androsaceus JB14 TaxID=1447944 RepID=A0A6A4HPC1_9AGAR|nr:hypothetical protein BT96DRAFT_993839 [Gymnopus androsaceus JB14]